MLAVGVGCASLEPPCGRPRPAGLPAVVRLVGDCLQRAAVVVAHDHEPAFPSGPFPRGPVPERRPEAVRHGGDLVLPEHLRELRRRYLSIGLPLRIGSTSRLPPRRGPPAPGRRAGPGARASPSSAWPAWSTPARRCRSHPTSPAVPPRTAPPSTSGTRTLAGRQAAPTSSPTPSQSRRPRPGGATPAGASRCRSADRAPVPPDRRGVVAVLHLGGHPNPAIGGRLKTGHFR